MRCFPLLALTAAFAVSACADADEPTVVDSDTVTVEAAPNAAETVRAPDVADDVEPATALAEEPLPEPPPPPAASTPPVEPAPTSKATGTLSAVTFFNNTGMSISHLYVAGCDESEGNDWDDMASWAQERLGGDALEPDESTVVEYADGCYVAEPHYVGEGAISEKVIVDGPTRVDFTIG